MSTEVAVPAGAEVLSPDELAALQAQQQAEFANEPLQTPILKIGESLTKEVQAGDAEPGEFINSLTEEVYGTRVDFIVSWVQTGRFARDAKTGRAYVAFGETIPATWEDLVGPEFVGTPFSEYPDAEERYKERVNNKEIEWGQGPLISTTYNYTGHVLVPVIEDEEDTGEVVAQPVRLSLKRSNTASHRKFRTLLATLRNRPYWDKVFELGTEKKTFTRGPSHILTVRLGRDTTPEERVAGVQLAQAVAAGRVTDNQATLDDKPAEPKAKGGLGV